MLPLAQNKNLQAVRHALVTHSDSRLTVKQEEVKSRLLRCWTLITDTQNTTQDVVDLLMSDQKARKEPPSIATAYRTMKATREVFGDFVKTTREVDVYLTYARAERVYTEAMAAAEPDLDNANKAIANMVRIKGLDREPAEAFDHTKLEPHSYSIGLDKNSKELMQAMLLQGRVNLNEHMPPDADEEETEDTDFTEVAPEEDTA